MADDRQEVVLMLHDFSFRSPQEIFAGLRGGASSAAGDAGYGARGDAGHAPWGQDGRPSRHGGHGGHGHRPSWTSTMSPTTRCWPTTARSPTRRSCVSRRVDACGCASSTPQAASNFSIDLGARRGVLVAVDGHPVTPVAGSIFPIAVAQRIDVTLDLPPRTGRRPGARHAGRRAQAQRASCSRRPGLGSIKWRCARSVPAPPLDARFEASLRATVPLPPKTADRTLPVALTGSMRGYVWGLDGRVYGQDRPLIVRQGERVGTRDDQPDRHVASHASAWPCVPGRRDRRPSVRRRAAGHGAGTAKTTVTVAFDADNPASGPSIATTSTIWRPA